MHDPIRRVYSHQLFRIAIRVAITSCLICGKPVQAQDPDLQRGGWSYFSSKGPRGGVLPVPEHPGLSGFRFNFQGGDHHIAQVTATLDCSITNGILDRWYVNYADDNGDDSYWYDIGWQQLPQGTVYGHGSAAGTMYHTLMTLGPATPGTLPVLTGFKFSRSSGDMHLASIGAELVLPGDSGYDPNFVRAQVWFTDNQSGQANRSCSISYAEVPSDHIRQLPGVWLSSSGPEATGNLDAERPVLQSFWMMFHSGDHHIDRLGAEVGSGRWRITFEDQNHDDPYEYYLRAADLIP